MLHQEGIAMRAVENSHGKPIHDQWLVHDPALEDLRFDPFEMGRINLFDGAQRDGLDDTEFRKALTLLRADERLLHVLIPLPRTRINRIQRTFGELGSVTL